jgi:hypothetical protein
LDSTGGSLKSTHRPPSPQESGETVQSVEVRIDSGAYDAATGTTSWSYSWNTTGQGNGPHTVYVKCRDKPYAFVRGMVNLTRGGDSRVVGASATVKDDVVNVTVNPLSRFVDISMPVPRDSATFALNFGRDKTCKRGSQNTSFERMQSTMACETKHCSTSVSVGQPVFFSCADPTDYLQNTNPDSYIYSYR